MLRKPGSSSLDLNLPTPSTEGERRLAADGSRTWRSPEPHPAWRCLFYHTPMNLCAETLNFHCRTWLCPQPLLRPGPGAALGGSRLPHGHRPGWGRKAKQTRSRSASPRHVHTQEQASWPQGSYCLCRAGEPGPGLRHTLISCINCVGARRTGKATDACCLVRSRTPLRAPLRSQPCILPWDGLPQPFFSLHPSAAAWCLLLCCSSFPNAGRLLGQCRGSSVLRADPVKPENRG